MFAYGVNDMARQAPLYLRHCMFTGRLFISLWARLMAFHAGRMAMLRRSMIYNGTSAANRREGCTVTRLSEQRRERGLTLVIVTRCFFVVIGGAVPYNRAAGQGRWAYVA